MKSKAISGGIALAYLTTAGFAGGSESTVIVAVFLILPLACIWYCDALGEMRGGRLGNAAVTRRSPSSLVAFCGWLLLTLPLVFRLVTSLGASL